MKNPHPQSFDSRECSGKTIPEKEQVTRGASREPAGKEAGRTRQHFSPHKLTCNLRFPRNIGWAKKFVQVFIPSCRQTQANFLASPVALTHINHQAVTSTRNQLRDTRMEVGKQVSECAQLLTVTPWTVACQAPLSVRFSRQEYWSGFAITSGFCQIDSLLDLSLSIFLQKILRVMFSKREAL